MNPKSLIAPVIVGAIAVVIAAFLVKGLKAEKKVLEENVDSLTTSRDSAQSKADAADREKKAALEAQTRAEKELAAKQADLAKLTEEKKQVDADLAAAQAKVTTLEGQMDALKKSTGESAKAFQELTANYETAKKSLSTAEELKKQADAKVKTTQGEYAALKAQLDASKDAGYLAAQYKTNPDGVRRQVEQLTKEVPDLAAKLGVSGGSGSGGDALRADVALRLVTLNLEGQFAYAGDNDAKKNDALTWTVGAVVIGMDANQVYILATPPARLLDQPAAVNSLTKNCTLNFSVHPAGWAGVKDALPAVLLGVLRGPSSSAVAVFAASAGDWPQGREKPLGLIAAPTVQECRQWTVDGELGFVYARGMPMGAGSGPIRMETPIKVGEQQVAVILPAQATGYELGLFGTTKAPSDKSLLGIVYPEGHRVLWLSDLYNNAKTMSGEIAKLPEVAGLYVGSDWVVSLGERKTLRGVDAISADFVTFLEKR